MLLHVRLGRKYLAHAASREQKTGKKQGNGNTQNRSGGAR
jgi:hypothetical protein